MKKLSWRTPSLGAGTALKYLLHLKPEGRREVSVWSPPREGADLMQKRPGTPEHHLGSNASRRWRGVVRRVLVNVSAVGILSLGLVAIDSIAPQFASAAPSLSTLTIPTTGLNPVPQTTPRVFPVALSCPSATSCVSTGQYYDLNGAYQGFIGVGTLSGGQWSWTLSTLNVGSTTGLSPAALSNVSVGPDSISCPSTTSCLLTGDYEDVNYHVDGFVAAGTLSGGVWTWVLSTLSTSGLSPAAVSNPVTTSSISCPSTTSCLLTGQYYVTNTNSYGFFATGSLSGGVWTWTLKTLPNTGANPAPQSGTGVSAASLSCPSTTSCIMTGSYVATSPNTYGFVGVGTLSGGVWSWAMSTLVTTTLNPIPSSATSSTVVSINPYSLSCPAVNSCVVVGGYLDTNQNNDGFIVVGTLSASTWTWSASTLSTTALVPASNPSPSSYTNPDVISCPSTTSCVAMGTYENTSANNDAMVITGTLSAGTWTWIPSEAPTTGLNPASITAQGLGPGGISCPSAARCVATGSYQANIPGGGLGAEGFATSIVTLPTASVPTITNLPSSGIVGGSFVDKCRRPVTVRYRSCPIHPACAACRVSPSPTSPWGRVRSPRAWPTASTTPGPSGRPRPSRSAPR